LGGLKEQWGKKLNCAHKAVNSEGDRVDLQKAKHFRKRGTSKKGSPDRKIRKQKLVVVSTFVSKRGRSYKPQQRGYEKKKGKKQRVKRGLLEKREYERR